MLTIYLTIINWFFLIFMKWIDVEDIESLVDSLAKIKATINRHGAKLEGQ